MRDHAGGFPVAGQHDFGGGRAARRQFGREPDPATVRRHARLDAGGAGGGGEAALNLHRRQPDHPIRGGGVGVGGAKGADRLRGAVFEIPQVGGVPLLICFRARLNGVTCMGGGLWTSAAIPLALAYHPVWVLGISAGAVALWLLVWALLFRGRLGLG